MFCITSLEQDVKKYCDEAEEKHMSLFLKSNALGKTIKDKKQVVKDLDFFDLWVRGGGKKCLTLKSFIWYTVCYVELL